MIISSLCIKLLGLVHSSTFNFSSLEICTDHWLYITIVRSKLEFVSVVWNSFTSTNANKLDRIQNRFQVLSFNRFFTQVHNCYSLALEELKVHTLRMRRFRLHALFRNHVYLGSKFCSSVLETVGLRVPAGYIRHFAFFNVCCSCKNCPSARCVSAAIVVCMDVDVFRAMNVLFNHIL
jgi:hypothetical protein